MAEQGKKGVANVVRQTWDRAKYEERARLRASGQLPDHEEDEPKKAIASNREEFQAADEGAAGPAGSARAFIKAREKRVSLETNVGTVKVVKSDDLSKNGGYFCEVCEVTLKDSVAYLDHINGKRHLRKLGFSMRVERSTVDQVKNRLQSAAKRKYDPIMTKKLDAMEEYEKKVKAAQEEEARIKRQKKEEKKARRQQDTASKPQAPESTSASSKDAEDAAEQVNDADAEMMAMMGFGGFGGSKKN